MRLECGHDRLGIGVHDAFLRVPLVEVADDSPVAAANEASIAELETGELATAGIARDELMQPRLEGSSGGEVAAPVRARSS